MQPRDVRAYLLDAQAACKAIGTFLLNVDEKRYAEDLLIRSAVERQLLIVGEAVNHIKRMDSLLAATLGDVWGIIAFRNLLAHGYFLVKSEIVWGIATGDVPRLLSAVEEGLREPSAKSLGETSNLPTPPASEEPPF
jgi:uncharacterized protein with HEPN domain